MLDLFVSPSLLLLFLLFACRSFVLAQEEGLCLWLSSRRHHRLRSGCFIQILPNFSLPSSLLPPCQLGWSVFVGSTHTHLGAAAHSLKQDPRLFKGGDNPNGGLELLLRTGVE